MITKKSYKYDKIYCEKLVCIFSIYQKKKSKLHRIKNFTLLESLLLQLHRNVHNSKNSKNV